LLWGTLQATLFCLLVSVPIAVLAALYVSQFVHQRMRGLLKPAVELMAALPSVVLGFVAAVWLAPKLEHALSGLFLAVVAAPLVAAAGGAAFRRLPSGWRARTAAGSELLPIAVLVAGTVAVSFAVAPTIERLVLGSEFPDWVRRTLGLEFDQKNAVVVAMAMAIAVIPIVFSIAEEAFSNVPRSLVSASLALGADRWQTAVQVVAPAASAGVFSGVMVGFGRAIGETMIVLMAVGATPIIDANPFTGFRTLSANVAIEIPEAPHGGTLYRVLFFAALLLLVLTFVVNTVAELIRTRLRSRHAAV
jgi:phosphate transport system permease protein